MNNSRIINGKKTGKRNLKKEYNRYNMYRYSIDNAKKTTMYSRVHICIIEFE